MHASPGEESDSTGDRSPEKGSAIFALSFLLRYARSRVFWDQRLVGMYEVESVYLRKSWWTRLEPAPGLVFTLTTTPADTSI